MSENINEMEEMEEDGIITLVDESGKEIEFTHIATVEYKDEWYIVLEPNEKVEGMEDGDVVIYKLGIDDEDEDTFIPVEDEDTLQAVFDEFMKLVEEAECDCDDDCDGDCDCDHCKH